MHNIKISILSVSILLIGSAAIQSEELSIHKRIDQLILNGDFIKAEQEANSAYEKNPNDIETICAKACVYRNMAYKNGVQIDKSRLGIKENESGTANYTPEIIKEAFKDVHYYDKEIFSKAEPLYYKAIELDKNYLNAYFNLLNTYMVMKDFEKYFKVIDLLIKNQKSNTNCKDILLDLAGKLFKQQSWHEAEKLYGIILENYPDFTYAKSDLGVVYFTNGEIDKAVTLLADVFQKDPQDLVNSINLSKAYIAQEKFVDSLRVTLTILTIKGSDYFNYFYAGEIAYLLGKDASTYFNKFIEIHKSKIEKPDHDFYINISKKYMELSELSEQQKIEFLSYVLEQFYNNNYYYDSVITANSILKLKTQSAPLVMLAAIFDNKIYNPQKALQYLDKIQEYSKTDPDIMTKYNLHYNYGRNLINLEKYDEAISHLKQNYEEKKDDANVLYAIGRAYQKKNDSDNACKFYTISSRLNDKENMYSINASIRESVNLGCTGNKK